ncbi:tail fiber protein [Serratia phage 92A1]|nr:tail fiber protein [Serratia phage 92A1]
MADLKAGSTVGGNLIWNKGSLPFNPVTPNSVYYKTYKVFTENDPPKAAEVDAVSASQGGTFEKQVLSKVAFIVSKSGSPVNGGIYAGDNGASFTDNNIELRSSYGIAIMNQTSGGTTNVGYFDTRLGHLVMQGEGRFNKGVYDTNNRVYSSINRPSPADLGAVSKTGDTLQGLFYLSGSGSSFTFGNAVPLYGTGSDSKRASLIQINGTQIEVGDTANRLLLKSLANPQVQVGNSTYTMYHTGNKPSSADVGLGNVLDARQLKWAGDVNRSGDFEFRNLKLSVDPTNDEHAVRLGYLNDKALVRRGRITNDDWNTITSPGMYDVNAGASGKGPNFPPTSVYGQLNVFVNTSTGKISQVYYVNRAPSELDSKMAWRTGEMKPGGIDWFGWSTVANDTQNNNTFVSRIGDTMTGPLNLTGSATYRHSGKDVLYMTGVDTYVGNFDGAIQLRGKAANGLRYNIGGAAWQVYHEGNKPNNTDIGLDKVTNDPQAPFYTLPSSNSGTRRYFKVATFAGSGFGNHGIVLYITGGVSEGLKTPVSDIVTMSARDYSASTPWTQAEADSRLTVTRTSNSRTTSAMYQYFVSAPNPGTNVLELWIDTNTYTYNSKMQIMFQGGNATVIKENFETVTSLPTNSFKVNVADVFSTQTPPTKAEVGLGNVGNYLAVNKDGDSMGPLTSLTTTTNWLRTTGSANLIPDGAGTTISYNRESNLGRTDFINHNGTTGRGGFVWWTGSGSSFEKAMFLDGSDSRLYPDAITISPKSSDPSFNSLVLKGVQHSPLMIERTGNNGNVSMGFRSGNMPWTYFGRRQDGQMGYGTTPSIDGSDGKLLVDESNFSAQIVKPNPTNASWPSAPQAVTGFKWAPNMAKYDWPVGVQIYQTGGADNGFSGSKGYPGYKANGVPNDENPVDNVLGTLVSFVHSSYRNLQLYSTSGKNDLWFRSMRDGSTAEQATDYAFTRVFTTAQPPSPTDVNAVPMRSTLDFGTF